MRLVSHTMATRNERRGLVGIVDEVILQDGEVTQAGRRLARLLQDGFPVHEIGGVIGEPEFLGEDKFFLPACQEIWWKGVQRAVAAPYDFNNSHFRMETHCLRVMSPHTICPIDVLAISKMKGVANVGYVDEHSKRRKHIEVFLDSIADFAGVSEQIYDWLK